ncbi:MAG: hypothetical protein NC218_01605 [Acetobacter sp.]|nr:hypothetical protein [Acetobacter sp.]
MIKKATVVSQRPSAAKKGAYLTVINDGNGELRAYSTRKLVEGEQVVVSVQQGANRDPLSVEILTKKQADNWLAQQLPQPEQTIPEPPYLDWDTARGIVEKAIEDVVDGYDDISTNTFCAWLKKGATITHKEVAKRIYAIAREQNFVVTGAMVPLIASSEEYPKVEVRISVIDNDDYDARINFTLTECS